MIGPFFDLRLFHMRLIVLAVFSDHLASEITRSLTSQRRFRLIELKAKLAQVIK